MNLTDMKEILTSRIRAYLAVPEAQEENLQIALEAVSYTHLRGALEMRLSVHPGTRVRIPPSPRPGDPCKYRDPLILCGFPGFFEKFYK